MKSDDDGRMTFSGKTFFRIIQTFSGKTFFKNFQNIFRIGDMYACDVGSIHVNVGCIHGIYLDTNPPYVNIFDQSEDYRGRSTIAPAVRFSQRIMQWAKILI